jgi:hypothetical protein
MDTDWVRAAVIWMGSGFGRVALDGGEELLFDADAVSDSMQPKIGEVVRVQVGVGRSGARKVTALEPLEAPASEPAMLPQAFNAELDRGTDARRFFRLDTADAEHVYFLLAPESAEQITRKRALRISLA